MSESSSNPDLRTATRYFDEPSGVPLHLTMSPHVVVVDGVTAELDGVPTLKNETTGDIYLPVKAHRMIMFFVEKAKSEGVSVIQLKPNELGKKRYPFSEKFEFRYSQIDYEYIPGLIRPWDEGFLTPVFFNIALLNKYSQDPKYRLELVSQTYGTIYAENWIISFGINRNKKVIMWLGDIDKLPEEEKYYLRSENVESDHEIHSEFYDSQIDVQFSERSRQGHLLHIRADLNDAVDLAFGYRLFTLEGEVSNVIENLDRPIFWTEKHVGPFVQSMNSIFVESLNVQAIKKAIATKEPERETKSIKSISALQSWAEIILSRKDFYELLTPFFVLYDLRIFFAHLLSDEKREDIFRTIVERLDLPSGTDNLEQIVDELTEKLISSIESIAKEFEC